MLKLLNLFGFLTGDVPAETDPVRGANLSIFQNVWNYFLDNWLSILLLTIIGLALIYVYRTFFKPRYIKKFK